MCGIYGILSETLPPKKDLITKLERLKHRGPDHMLGKQLSENVFLGHTRLSILDLDKRSHQPMSDHSNRFTITFNGEIYNYLEIKEELINLGHSFKTTSDTEVILYAFMEWEEECLHKFNGMWAFAIWDSTRKKLFLARDRFGVKPLYIHRSPGLIEFASEMKVFEEEINARFVFNALSFFPVDCQRETLLEGVEQLLPGECAWASLNSYQTRRYWDTSHYLSTPLRNERENIERFGELLKDACRLRLRADVPLATALSGGLDSSSIASLIAQENTCRFDAFIASYPHSSQDELRYAQDLAQHHAIPQNVVSITADSCIKSIESVIWATEDCVDLATGPYLLYQQYANKQVKISIDGHGADELLAGYRHYPQVALSKQLLRLGIPRGLELCWTLHRMGESYTQMANHLLHKITSKLRKKGSPSLLVEQDPYVTPLPPELYKNRDPIDQALFRDFHFNCLPAILRRFDRCSMAHGVEVRSPFLDWRIVSFLFSLPSTYKIRQGYTKYLLRKSMHGELPQHILNRTEKLGFTNPIVDWCQNKRFQSYLLDHSRSKTFLENPHFDGAAVARRFEESGDIGSFWRFFQTSRLIERFSLVGKDAVSV